MQNNHILRFAGLMFLSLMVFALISCSGNEAEEERATDEVEEVTPPPPPPPPPSAKKRSEVKEMRAAKAEETPEEFHAIEETEVAVINEVEFIPHRFSYEDLETEDEPLHVSMKAFDTPPIYGKKCVDDETPDDCTQEAVKAYFKNRMNFPDEASKFEGGITEYVSFIVKADGSVDGSNIQVLPQEPQCHTCAAEALVLIREMPKWTPAEKGGTPVPARITVPITFLAEG